jgi:hypothetical protein
MIRPVLAFAAVLTMAAAPAPRGPQILTEDVTRFYQVYDAAGGKPTAQELQRGYLVPGTPGLKDFVKARITSADRLAAEIAKSGSVFDKARACRAAMPGVKARLKKAFAKLAQLYPEAVFPPVTVVVGRNTSGGTTGPSGVLIGLETLCRADWLEANLEDRFVHLIAHEYAHVEQRPEGGEDADPGDLLTQSLTEGGADFTAELISGETGNVHLKQWTKGRELQIETAFMADRSGKDLSKWLYNGVGTPEKPGDLGYWVGYRIVKAYWLHAKDKRQAMREIFNIRDPEAFLKQSGWTPGMKLP